MSKRTPGPWTILLGLLASGCMGPPTGPTPPELTHPNEVMMKELLQCNADLYGLGAVDLYWLPARIHVTTPDGQGFVACNCGVGQDYIHCDQRWVREAARAELADAAAHEVCHITGNLEEPPAKCRDKALETCD